MKCEVCVGGGESGKEEEGRSKEADRQESQTGAMDMLLLERVYNADDQQTEIKKIRAEMLLRTLVHNQKMGGAASSKSKLEEKLLNMIYEENENFGKYVKDCLTRLVDNTGLDDKFLENIYFARGESSFKENHSSSP